MRHVLFSFSSDELLCVPCVFCDLLSLLKLFVWSQRNDYHFRSKPPSAVGLIASIKGCLSFYLPLLFKRFRSRRTRRFFQSQGVANGRIGKVVDDSFHFCLLSVVRVNLPRSPLLAVLWYSWSFFFA